jgi:hypothetical protein
LTLFTPGGGPISSPVFALGQRRPPFAASLEVKVDVTLQADRGDAAEEGEKSLHVNDSREATRRAGSENRKHARPDFSDYVVHFTKERPPSAAAFTDAPEHVAAIAPLTARERLVRILEQRVVRATPMPR